MKVSGLDYVVLIVSDLERSLAFYCATLGLPIRHRSGHFAQLETGSTRLALYQRDAMSETLGFLVGAPDPERPGFELGFFVESVDRAYREIVDSGAAPVTPPADRPWRQRTAYVRDPDGHLVELVERTPNPIAEEQALVSRS